MSDTRLLDACRDNNSDLVKTLLEDVAIEKMINARENVYGDTPLMIAAKKGNVAIITLLKTYYNASHDAIREAVNYKTNGKGNTALFYAIENGSLPAVELILDIVGIDVNIKATELNLTALILATSLNRLEIVKKLLEKRGIDINATANDGISALLAASIKGHTEIVKALLEMDGIDANPKTASNLTALSFSAKNGHTEIVKALLDFNTKRGGIDINAKDKHFGNTALIFAVNKKNFEMVEALLNAPGIDTNVRNNFNKTAYELSARQDERIREMLETHILPKRSRSPSPNTESKRTKPSRGGNNKIKNKSKKKRSTRKKLNPFSRKL